MAGDGGQDVELGRPPTRTDGGDDTGHRWWLPAWLDRILPHVDLDGETGRGVAEPVPTDPRRDVAVAA